MARRAGKKKLTLSEHLALRAQAAEEAKEREETRQRTIDALRILDAEVLCTCPACQRRRGLL